MKKSLKFMSLGLAVIPCALMLTACGGENPEKNLIDITGDYTEVESTEYSAVLDEVAQGFDLNEIAKGIQAVIKINAESTISGMGKISLELKNESIAKGNSSEGVLNTGDIEVYTGMGLKFNLDSEVEGLEDEEMSGSFKQYIKDGYQYFDYSKIGDLGNMMGSDSSTPDKYKVSLNGELPSQIVIPEFDLGEYLAYIPEGEWGETLIVSKCATATGYKIKVSAAKDTLNAYAAEIEEVNLVFSKDIELYMIYENEQFAGLYLDTAATVTVAIPEDSIYYQMFGSSLTANVSVSAEIAGFNGEIKYPKLSSFVDLTEPE